MVLEGRRAAQIEGDFVVFLIGARINRFREPRAWLPVVRSMPKMLAELERRPELGLLHATSAVRGIREVLLIQYWRSFDHLHGYARARESEHLPAWAAYNRAIGRTMRSASGTRPISFRLASTKPYTGTCLATV